MARFLVPYDMLLTATLGEPPALIGRFRADRADAWLWGALAGWDCEETHEHLPHCFLAMVEVAEQHQWDVVDVARLRGLRAAIRAAAVGAEPG